MFKSCDLCANILFKLKNNNISIKRAIQTKFKPKIQSNERPIISCKRKEYDFYPIDYKNNVNKLDAMKLASKGWHNKLSRGDYFIIHMADEREILDMNMSYTEFGLDNKLVENLARQGIKHPTEIQKEAIPVLLTRKNSLINAETGCGKTLSYLLPVLQQILEYKRSVKETNSSLFNSPICLILTPSRELAFQIENVAKRIAEDLDISTDTIVGGGTKRKMLNPSFKEVNLLVATLGALSKLTTTGIYKMNQVKHVILDEADTLLDESFSEKLSHFLKKFPFQYSAGNLNNFTGTQLTLCSATILSSLPNILSEIIVPDSLVHLSTNRLHKLLSNVPQRFIRLTKSIRPTHLLSLIKNDAAKNYPVIIFSNTSKTCDWISLFLNENGIKCINLNGDMSLFLRKNKFLDFQNGDVNVLSCTDIGSRGLDTIRVKHVINYDFPKYTSDYIHRCGRIGRIGSPKNCHVTNFVCGYKEIELTQQLEMAVRRNELIPNVNANISGIIRSNILRSMREEAI